MIAIMPMSIVRVENAVRLGKYSETRALMLRPGREDKDSLRKLVGSRCFFLCAVVLIEITQN